jgi:hypothetical protein
MIHKHAPWGLTLTPQQSFFTVVAPNDHQLGIIRYRQAEATIDEVVDPKYSAI